MELSRFDQAEQVGHESLAPDAASLEAAFEQVKDGRGKKGQRYPLALIFTLLMLGKLAGETSIEGIIDWIEERKKELQQLFSWAKRFAAQKTYRCALAQCAHHEIAKAIAQVVLRARAAEQCDEHPSGRLSAQGQSSDKLTHTAVDGKIMAGTLKHGRSDQPAVHLLSFSECESGIVLDQFVVESKHHEEATCLAILHPVLVKGRILSGDAIESPSRVVCGGACLWRLFSHPHQGEQSSRSSPSPGILRGSRD